MINKNINQVVISSVEEIEWIKGAERMVRTSISPLRRYREALGRGRGSSVGLPWESTADRGTAMPRALRQEVPWALQNSDQNSS